MTPPPRDALPPHAVVRVVLLGYMGSGKSSVGASLARRLEWEYLDFDVEIERRTGVAVRDIIETEGQEKFREMEAALTQEAAEAGLLVLAPGGGWITRPEMLEALGRGTLSVWLQVTPEETARRIKEDTIDRPFRDHPDPVDRIAEMLAEREPLYRLADLSVPSDGRSVEEIAFEIEQVVRQRAQVALS